MKKALKNIFFFFIAISILLTIALSYFVLQWYVVDVLPCLRAKPAARLNFSPKSTAGLDLFLPKAHNTDAAIIIFPGGAYGTLVGLDGTPVSKWLADNNITSFVLNYRLPDKGNYCLPLTDAVNAVAYVRKNAAVWQLSKNKIGVMGFSAGAHLASLLTAHPEHNDAQYKDKQFDCSSCPNFEILISPVISMENNQTNLRSRLNFLGKNPPESQVKFFSSEQNVHAGQPPLFIFHSRTDKIAPVAATDCYVRQLKLANVPVRYVMGWDAFALDGGHGKGLDPRWQSQLISWLNDQILKLND